MKVVPGVISQMSFLNWIMLNKTKKKFKVGKRKHHNMCKPNIIRHELSN